MAFSFALLRLSLTVPVPVLASVPVEPGLKNWEFVEVKGGGLAEGDLVVVSLDRAEVREGARVRIAGETRK